MLKKHVENAMFSIFLGKNLFIHHFTGEISNLNHDKSCFNPVSITFLPINHGNSVTNIKQLKKHIMIMFS